MAPARGSTPNNNNSMLQVGVKEKERSPQVGGKGCNGGGKEPAHRARGRPPPGNRTRGPAVAGPAPPRAGGGAASSLRRKQQPETVVFVPATEGSRLSKALQTQDNPFAALHGTPAVKFVERGGRNMSKIIGTTDPCGGLHCGRQKCIPCNDTTTYEKLAAPKRACTVENCLYSLECLLCEREDHKIRAHYYGESGQSAHTRGKEHSDGVARKDPDHPIIKHMKKKHGAQAGQDEPEPEWRNEGEENVPQATPETGSGECPD